MMRRFTLILLGFFAIGICSAPDTRAQAVQVSLGNDTTLPCGVNCTSLQATLTKVASTSSYTLDSSLSYANHPSFTAGTLLTFSSQDDGFSPLVTLPFSFCFYGTSYSSLVVGTNGELTFNSGLASSPSGYTIPTGIPTGSYHPPSILPAYHDLYPLLGGAIRYNTTGTAPNRKFVVSYYQVPHYNGSVCAGYTSTFQVVLNETSNIIEFYIQDKPACTGWQSGLAISGIQNNTTQAMALPGKNATVWGGYGLNKAYQFIPSGATLPTVTLLSATGTFLASATPVTSPTNPNQLTASFNNICLTADSANYIVRVIYPCPTTTIYDTIKVKRLVTPKPLVSSPVSYCQLANATALSAAGQNLLWYTSSTGGTGSSTAPVPNTATVGTQVYYVSQTINSCESARDSIVVNIIANTAPVLSSNSPVCEGDTLQLFSTGMSGAAYAWTGPGGFTASVPNPVIPGATTAHAGSYTLTTTAAGCSSSASLTVVVNPAPVITSVNFSNPTSCGGSDGTITVQGLINGGSYTLSYSKNSVPQTTLTLTAAGGAVVITGLTAGSYTNISVTINGCTGSYAAGVQLTDPNAPAIPVVSNNGPLCEGQTLNLSSGAVAGASYSWTGPGGFSSGLQNPVIGSITAGQSGVYSLTVSVNNCTSGAGTTQVVVHPTPVISNVTGINPTTCLGTDGSIQISGLTPNTVYTINYTKNGVAQTAVTGTAGATGVLILTGLGAGSYAAITVTSAASCTSAAAGPAVLTDPAPPAAPVAGSNSPLCGGATLSLTASALTGATYAWTGPNGFTSNAQNPVINPVTAAAAGVYSVTVTTSNCTSGAGTVTVIVDPVPAAPAAGSNSPVCEGSTLNLTATTVAGASYSWTGPNGFVSAVQNPSIGPVTPAAGGTYTVTATVNGCVSANATATVVVNPVPVIGASTGSNPTNCNGTDGSITMTGLTPATAYTVNYTKNGTAQPPLLVTSGAGGTVVITGLGAGIYANISLSLNGCTSAAAGPVTLSDPAAPAVPAAANNGPLCAGGTLNLTASGVAGGGFSWTGPGGFSSTTQNPVLNNIQPSQAGVYSVTVSLNNCISAPGTTTVSVSPLPVISSAAASHPTSCGGTNGTITLNGLPASTSYTVNFMLNGNPVPAAVLTSSVSGSLVITGLGAGTYSNITVSIGGCISMPSGPFTLVDPAAPAAPVAGSNSPVCEGNTINLTASLVAGASYSWTGPNGFSSAAQNPVIANAQAVNAGTYSVTVNSNNCISTPATTSVVVNPSPVIALAGSTNPSGCNATNGDISISGLAVSASYTVSFTKNGVPQPSVVLSTNAAGVLTVTGLNAATYTNIIVTLAGCGSNALGPVILSDPSSPPQPAAANNGPLCAGATLNLTASMVAGATYSWTGPNGFSSSLQNPGVPNAQAINAGLYSVTVTLNGCTSVPGTTNVVIAPVPLSPVVSSNSPLCEGANLTLTATTSPGASYSWTGPNGFSSAAQNPVINNATIAAAGVYTVTASQGSCAAAPTSITVTVNAVPAAPAVSGLSYCQFAAAGPLTATGQNLLWYTAASGGTGSGTAPVPATGTAGIFTWYVSQTVNGCESPRVPVAVTIQPAPAPPQVAGPVTYCQGALAAALSATGQNLLWYTQPSGGTGSPAAPVPPTTVPGTATWYVSQTVNGCESNRAAISVTVSPPPAAPVVSSPVQYCLGDAAAPLLAAGQNLLWYTQPSGGTGSTVAPVPGTAAAGSTTYYVSQSIAGCESGRSALTVTVHEPVFAKLLLSQNVICQFDTIMVMNDTANPSTATYSWDFDGGLVLSGSGAGPYLIKWNSNGSKTVRLTVTNGSCTDTASVTLTNKPSPLADFVLQEDACIEELINVQAAWNSLSNAVYNWSFDNGTVLSGTGAGLYRLYWTSPGQKVVSLQIDNNGCRSELVTDTIHIHPTPIAQITTRAFGDLCIGDTVFFRAAEGGDGAYVYTWAPEAYFPANGIPEVAGVIKKGALIRLTVNDAYGCLATDSLTLAARNCCELALPDAFTPNGDGRNDIFRVVTQGNHQVSAFRVANRWGQIVFETGNALTGWDGRFGGVAQDIGTYFYFIRYKCADGEEREQKGEVVLIR